MNYASGADVMIGDKVDLGDGQIGKVVGIIQERRYSVGYNSLDWDHLKTGLLIKTTFGDLRMDEPDEDLELISREGSNLEMHG